jgi:hypothetical protein
MKRRRERDLDKDPEFMDITMLTLLMRLLVMPEDED